MSWAKIRIVYVVLTDLVLHILSNIRESYSIKKSDLTCILFSEQGIGHYQKSQ